MVKRRVTELTNPEAFQEIKMVSPVVIRDFSFDGVGGLMTLPVGLLLREA